MGTTSKYLVCSTFYDEEDDDSTTRYGLSYKIVSFIYLLLDAPLTQPIIDFFPMIL